MKNTTAFYILASIFVFGGAVNRGVFDFLPAIPFLIYVLYITYKFKGTYKYTTIVLLIGCYYLFSMKRKQTPLFYPNIGKTFYLSEDVCLLKFSDAENTLIGGAARECEPSNDRYARLAKSEILPKNTVMSVKKIYVSNADFAENYYIVADTSLGELQFFRLGPAHWTDGTRVEQADLRRDIFYLPSLLMYWPVAPVHLLMALRVFFQ